MENLGAEWAIALRRSIGQRVEMGSGRGAERSVREWGRFGGERGAAPSGSRGSWGSAER